MKTVKTAILAAASTVLIGTGAAHAASTYQYGYELTIDGSGSFGYNAPRIALKNTGNANIAGMSLTIGDSQFNFDAVVEVVAGDLGYSLLGPDTVNNGVRSDVLELAFTGFELDEAWSALIDIDHDNFTPGKVGTIEDARNILWNSAADNAQIAVTFEDGFTLLGELPDDFQQQVLALLGFGGPQTQHSVQGDVYSFAQNMAQQDEPAPQPHVTPTPAAALAGLVMLGGLMVRRKRD